MNTPLVLSSRTGKMVRSNALMSLANGQLAKKRRQTICTGPEVIDVMMTFYDGCLVYDFASPSEPELSIVPAQKKFTRETTPDGLEALESDLELGNGYINPPFDDLETWLSGARTFHRHTKSEVLFLMPWRSHRTWYTRYLHNCCVATLKPQRFLGYKDDFPAPLVLAAFIAKCRYPAFMRAAKTLSTGFVNIHAT